VNDIIFLYLHSLEDGGEQQEIKAAEKKVCWRKCAEPKD